MPVLFTRLTFFTVFTLAFSLQLVAVLAGSCGLPCRMVLAGEGVETLVYADEPVLAGDASMPLSALDRSHGGRAVPFVFFYKASLDVDRLIEALRTTLSAYPAVCGRYRAQADSTISPSRIDLSNAGVPVHVCHTETGAVSSAMEHLPPDSSPSSPAPVKIFARSVHETVVPTKVQMDPDRGSPDAPLLSFKITRFAGGGTAIGMLFQHHVCDADAAILFMKHWSQAFRGLPLDPAPLRDRCSIDALRPVAMSQSDVPALEGFRLQVLSSHTRARARAHTHTHTHARLLVTGAARGPATAGLLACICVGDAKNQRRPSLHLPLAKEYMQGAQSRGNGRSPGWKLCFHR